MLTLHFGHAFVLAMIHVTAAMDLHNEIAQRTKKQ
jgi:hypothetical protein